MVLFTCQRLFRCGFEHTATFEPQYCWTFMESVAHMYTHECLMHLWSACTSFSLESFHSRWNSHALFPHINVLYIYIVYMNPALIVSLPIRHFDWCIRNKEIIFVFHTGLQCSQFADLSTAQFQSLLILIKHWYWSNTGMYSSYACGEKLGNI